LKDPRIIRANERYKAIAGALTNLGTGLLAAAVVKMYADGKATLETASWFIPAGVLMFVGWQVLGLLDSED
jgi:hypothetical protein